MPIFGALLTRLEGGVATFGDAINSLEYVAPAGKTTQIDAIWCNNQNAGSESSFTMSVVPPGVTPADGHFVIGNLGKNTYLTLNARDILVLPPFPLSEGYTLGLFAASGIMAFTIFGKFLP